MSKGLSNKLAGQVGEFLVCAELGRRGLIATSFTGNVPEFDLIVADGSLKTLPVQVKTSRGHSWPTRASLWINVTIDEKGEKQIDHGDSDIPHPDLIYVCVLLAAPGADQADRYFILLKRDLQAICARNYRDWMSKHNWKRPKNFRSLDNRYYVTDLKPFENNWALFEQQLGPS
ncbi:hypothetical protein [Vreelandella arcis]|uniref:PD(D/E)XK endonuclease domain-containing protein n=1 Tax=Vreelandella arcis TaxID=416873 RepID=A0A1H0EBV9_9GAMM|nr:hypothetical protein [Halomonas arcis]SDN79808.1 hypothetical protein SAMN04487951_10893 [Halomonas arcis]